MDFCVNISLWQITDPITYLCYYTFHFLEQTYTCCILAKITSDYTDISPAPSLVRNHNHYFIKEICLEERLLLESHKFMYNTLQFNTRSGLALYSHLPQARWRCL